MTLLAVRDHEITPARGSMLDRYGNPTDGLSLLDFPLTATCAYCVQPIRLERYCLAEWFHVISQWAVPAES
jgi:hypothetical protein